MLLDFRITIRYSISDTITNTGGVRGGETPRERERGGSQLGPVEAITRSCRSDFTVSCMLTISISNNTRQGVADKFEVVRSGEPEEELGFIISDSDSDSDSDVTETTYFYKYFYGVEPLKTSHSSPENSRLPR